jgi:hypothetical protein
LKIMVLIHDLGDLVCKYILSMLIINVTYGYDFIVPLYQLNLQTFTYENMIKRLDEAC